MREMQKSATEMQDFLAYQKSDCDHFFEKEGTLPAGKVQIQTTRGSSGFARKFSAKAEKTREAGKAVLHDFSPADG